MREKSGMLLLSVLLPFSFFQGKKTKETGDEMEGKKMANVLTQTVGEAKLFSDT